MSHTSFVILSYGAAAIIFAALLAWMLWERARSKRALAQLEDAGYTRRSNRISDA